MRERKRQVDEQTQAFTRHYWERIQTTFVPNTWAGVMCWQNPCDVWIIQEIIGETRPDVIVETGTLTGGGAILWASLLGMFGDGRVITIDIQDAGHRDATTHPMAERVTWVKGSSTDPEVVAHVAAQCAGKRVMVILDSDHTAAHVSRELDAWSPLVSEGCYLVVQDGFVTYAEPERCPGPLEAVEKWLPGHREFQVDAKRERMLFTFCPSGYLRKVQGR
jgi:cephalosporin hydroxylase